MHEVTYDLLEKEFNVYLEEQKLDFTTKSYSEVIEMLSIFKYNQALTEEYSDGDKIEISVSAFLSKLKLESREKKFDMMLLWKNKEPQITKKLSIKMTS